MSLRTAILAIFATENRFVSLKFIAEGPAAATFHQMLGMHLVVVDGALLLRQKGGQPIKIVVGCPEDPEFGLCPEGPEAACADSDAYFSSCVSPDEWLAGALEGTLLPLYWWSATENAFDTAGCRVGFGPAISSH